MQVESSKLKVSVCECVDAGGWAPAGGHGATMQTEADVSGSVTVWLGVGDLANWLKAYSQREVSVEEWLAGELYEEADPEIYVTQVSIDAVRAHFERSEVEVVVTVEDWLVRR